jgi:hypothetical protein
VSRARAGLVVGTRAAGHALALVYLLGAMDGAVLIVVGALGLVAFGRVVAGRTELLYHALAFVVAAIGLTIPSLRWQLLELSELRGAQAVLGPTLLVGPPAVAVSTWIAALATLLGFGLGLASAPGRGVRWWLWSTIEAAVGALAAVTVYYGPAIPGWGNEGASIRDDVPAWAAAVGVAAVAIIVAAGVARELPAVARRVLLGGSGVAVLVAAGVLVATL